MSNPANCSASGCNASLYKLQLEPPGFDDLVDCYNHTWWLTFSRQLVAAHDLAYGYLNIEKRATGTHRTRSSSGLIV